jgi:malate dehydrogenase
MKITVIGAAGSVGSPVAFYIGALQLADVPCSVVLDGEYGLGGLSMSVPVRLGRGGVKEILEWELAPDEHEGLARTAAVLSAAARRVDESVA